MRHVIKNKKITLVARSFFGKMYLGAKTVTIIYEANYNYFVNLNLFHFMKKFLFQGLLVEHWPTLEPGHGLSSLDCQDLVALSRYNNPDQPWSLAMDCHPLTARI